MEKVKVVEEVVEESYKSVLSNKNFVKLLIGKVISRFGDSIDMVAYGWLVFQITGSAAMLAGIYAVSGIPSFFFNMISGVVVTYLNKKLVVLICDIGRGLVVLLTAALFIMNLLEVWHLFLFTFINSTFESFRAPASAPLFTKVLNKNQYTYAISASETFSKVAEISGFSIAAILISLIGVGGVIIIDALTFFICAVAISLIKLPKEKIEKGKLTFSNYFVDLKKGLLYVKDSKIVLNICIFAGVFNLFVIPFNALQPAYAEDVLKRGPEVISVMGIAMLLAMTVGSFIAPKLSKIIKNKTMFISSGLIIAVGYFLLASLSNVVESQYLLIYLAIASALMGIAVPLINLPIKVGLMSKVEDEYLPRTVSFVNALALSTTPIGGAAVGILVNFYSLERIYVIFSSFVLILFISQIFNKTLREL